MKQTIKFAAAAVALAFSVSASATVMTDTYTPKTAVTISQSDNYSYTFDFVKDYKFVAGKDSIKSANLTITLADSNGGTENFKFIVDDQLTVEDTKNVPNKGETLYGPYAITGSSLKNFSDTGKLSFAITESDKNGSFQFVSASLAGDLIKAQATNVPEPVSIALMGLGLFGIAGVRRRKS